MKSWMAVVSPMSDSKIRRTVAGLKSPKMPPSMRGCRQTDRRERREARERLAVIDELKLVDDRESDYMYKLGPEYLEYEPADESLRLIDLRVNGGEQRLDQPKRGECVIPAAPIRVRSTSWDAFR